MFSDVVTHYASGGVADSLIPSSSLLPIRCARGTTSTSLVLPSTSSSGTSTGASYAAGSTGLGLLHPHPPSSCSWSRSSFSALLFPCFCCALSRASRSVALRFVPVLWSAYFSRFVAVFFLALFDSMWLSWGRWISRTSRFFQVLRGLSCAKVTSHESSTLSSHHMS